MLQALGNSMPPLIETYTAALPAAMLNALLVPVAFVVCRKLLRALAVEPDAPVAELSRRVVRRCCMDYVV